MGVDAARPITPADPGSRTVYPVIFTGCTPKGMHAPVVSWRYTDKREFRARVNKTDLCLTRKKPFTPYLAAYLSAFASMPYIGTNYYPANATTTDTYSPLVVDVCGSVDGIDKWDFDPQLGTIATFDNLCATIMHNSMNVSAGMPYMLWSCAVTKTGTGVEHQQFSLSATPAWVGTFSARGARFPVGTVGLPIVGPLGKCLTAQSTGRAMRAVLSDCDGRQEQLWQWRADRLYYSSSDCLERLSDGSFEVRTCSVKSTQSAAYRLPQQDISGWMDTFQYGELRIGGACLSVDNIFLSPSRQQTRVFAGPCDREQALLRSWFLQTRMRTLRIQALRLTDDDGTRGSFATSGGVAYLVGVLNRQYERHGLRFSYNPATDFADYRNTSANTLGWGPTFSTDAAGSRAIDYVASNTYYGKIVIAFARGRLSGLKRVATDAASMCDSLRRSAAWSTPAMQQNYVGGICAATEVPLGSAACANAVLTQAFGAAFSGYSTTADLSVDMQCDAMGANCKKTAVDEVNAMCDFGGGWSSSCNNQATPSLMIDPINGWGCSDAAKQPGFQKSLDGYPAESYSIVLGGSDAANIVHEMGHYLGLDHTFTGDGDGIFDTIADFTSTYWDGLGIDRCGNPEGQPGTMPPDRRNTMNYFGCFFLPSMRSLSPQQAGKIEWKLSHQPNRTQLQSCKPSFDYDPNHVTCTTMLSFNQCNEAAAVLPGVVCSYVPAGGPVFSVLSFDKPNRNGVGHEPPGRDDERALGRP